MSALGIFFLVMVGIWLGSMVDKAFTADYRDDPVYKKNVQDLIERNRQFEKTE
jgi:hypothetical protein